MKMLRAIICVSILMIQLVGLAQDPLVMEKLNRLAGQVEDLQTAQMAMQKRLSEVIRELDSLREQVAKNAQADAMKAEIQRLEERVRQLEQKCASDREVILKELERLASIRGRSTQSSQTSKPQPQTTTQPVEMKGYEYVVQPGDTLSSIVQAYRQNNIKVTVDQVLKANPGLDPNKLRVGQKIFIPAPGN